MLANPDIGVTQIAHRLGVSSATLYRYIPAARTANTPGVWRRPLYPKERPFQEGFSLAAGGGSAPTPDLAPMTMEAGAVIGKARETDGIAVAAIVSGG
jgi:predicted DNA-binding transcriptional regulator YafY